MELKFFWMVSKSFIKDSLEVACIILAISFSPSLTIYFSPILHRVWSLYPKAAARNWQNEVIEPASLVPPLVNPSVRPSVRRVPNEAARNINEFGGNNCKSLVVENRVHPLYSTLLTYRVFTTGRKHLLKDRSGHLFSGFTYIYIYIVPVFLRPWHKINSSQAISFCPS